MQVWCVATRFNPRKAGVSMLQIPFFGSRIYVSLRHIWACQFRNQPNSGWANDPLPPPPHFSFFKTQKCFEVLLVIYIFFSFNLINFLGYKDIEETKIICKSLSNLSGAIVLWGKVTLKSQPSPPLTHRGRGGERWRLLALLLVLP